MSLTVAGIEFETHVYDERADVLYLAVASYDSVDSPRRADATPEGHGIEWDRGDRVIAMTLVNVRFLLERDGELVITWPAGHVPAGDLADALAPAA